MKHGDKTIFPPKWDLWATTAIFFLCFYLYAWLRIEPHLIYHGFGTVIVNARHFSSGWLFLKEHLAYPGGPVGYLSALLSQGYYYSWLGALIITLVAWLLCVVTRKFIAIAGSNHSRVICYIPALGLLISYNRYYHLVCYHHQLDMFMALLAVIWSLVIYAKISVRVDKARAAIFLGMFIILYYIAGGASLLFAVLVSAYEISTRRRLLSGGLYIVIGAALVWLAGVCVLEKEIKEAYLYLTPLYWELGDSILNNFAKVTMLCLYFLSLMLVILISPSQGLVKKKLSRFKHKRVLQYIVLAVITLLSVFLSSDIRKRNYSKMVYLLHHKMWNQILDHARQNPLTFYALFYNHCVNRALYHTGRLGDEMFRYPQKQGSLLPPMDHENFRDFIGVDFFLEFGHINLAEKKAYESLETFGLHPRVLKNLALINIAKGQTETARIFLSVLRKDLIYGREAKNLLNCLDKDPQLSDNREIQHLHSVAMTKDKDHPIFPEHEAEILFLHVLEGNRYNRMAFEYLMSFYMQTGELKKLANNIMRLDDFDYNGIPRHYEEAILTYEMITGEKMDLHGRLISNEAKRRFNEFGKSYTVVHKNNGLGLDNLRARFGDTFYFYYIFYRRSE
jgi:hypothetical protein